MQGKKQLRKIRQLPCLLLAVILVCGAVPTESALALESETIQETEAQIEETVQDTEPESVDEEPGNGETEPIEGAETEPTTNTESVESTETAAKENIETDKYNNSISGVLWLDANEDGAYDSGEQVLASYPVYLYLESDTDNAVQAATTDVDGKYLFEEITSGRYVVGIKAEENGTEYLLPLMGVKNNNKFSFTPDWSKVISNPIDIAADTAVEDIDAAMRTMPQIQPMADYTIDMSTVSAAGTGYSYASNVLTFTTAANNHTYTITGTTTTKRIVVNTGVTLNIILDGASITRTVTSSGDFYAAFQLVGTAKVTLTLADGSDNLMRIASSNALNDGIAVQSAATLTINGTTGKLTAIGMGSGGAGIGGGAGFLSGTITINGGIITATGSWNGAGIGGGESSDCGTITINGGSVTATGGGMAPGIGPGGAAGGSFGPNNITINGGTVTAKSGITTSPGIGSYSKTVNIGTVVFTGGSIYPTDSAGTVSVYPNPTNGSVNGNDPVGMLTFTQFAGQAFSFIAGGSLQSYPYSGIGHAAAAYPWMPYPGVSTEAATNVTANSATMNGTYYMNGTIISSAYFEWGTSTSYGNTETLTTPSATTSGTIDTTAANLNGLTSNTTYHYRLVIEVGSLKVPGNDVTFTTKPIVDTLTASLTGTSTATISGMIASGNAAISDVIITYATDAGFNTNVVTIDGSTGVTFTDTTYTANITGLTSGQTYYVKVEAVGPGGTSDAKTGSFLAGGYPVTEKFVDLSGGSVDATSLQDNTVFVSTGSYTASGIPTSHTTGGNTYTYLGYKLDSYTTGDALTSGTPSSVAITGSRDVYYVYGITEGSIKIEKYAHDGITLLPDAEFKLEKLDTSVSPAVVDPTFTAQTLPIGAGGSLTFPSLPAGSYQITETAAPSGYSTLAEPFRVDIPYDITLPSGQTPSDANYLYATAAGGSVTYHYYNLTYKVSDQAALGMPQAGSSGFLSRYYLWIGLAMLLAAGGTFVCGRKRCRV